MFEPLKDTVVKVRKPHVCVWCGEAIESQEVARYRVYVFNGDFNSEYNHIECYAAMPSAPIEEVEDGYIEGMFIRGTGQVRPEFS